MKPGKLIAAALTLSLLLAGCGMGGSIYSNYRQLEQLRPVEILGVDADARGVSVSAAAGAIGEDSGPLLLRRPGESILNAMNSLQDYSEHGRLFFSHVKYVLLGRSFAEEGVGELLDFAERDAGMRLDTELYLLSDSEAGELILAAGEEDFDVSELLDSTKRDLELRGAGHIYNFRETAVALSEYGAALVCMLRVMSSEGSASPGAQTTVPAGYGILKDASLVGELGVSEAEALGLLLGHPGTVSRAISDGRGGTVTLQFDGMGGGIEAKWDGERPAPASVTLRVRAVVAETENAPDDLMQDPGYLDGLTRRLEEELEKDLLAVLDKARTLDADFLALAGKLRRSGGGKFDALPEGWLGELEFEVSAEAVIDHSYDLDDPVGTDGGEYKGK